MCFSDVQLDKAGIMIIIFDLLVVGVKAYVSFVTQLSNSTSNYNCPQ